MDLLQTIDAISHLIGNTPTCRLKGTSALYAKLEHYNLMGSVKDRPAYYILRNAIRDGRVNKYSTVIESTSGNFGIALAGLCKRLGLKFIPVIDPNITAEKAEMLRVLSHRVVRVEERDAMGGYLLNRIEMVKELMKCIPEAFNPNQYENEDNFWAYYHSLGNEICQQFSHLDYLLVSVSSGGTITGLSRRLKEKFPRLQVIAVDIEGSLVFDDVPKARKLSGLGSSMRTPLVDKALIDHVIILTHEQILRGCHALLEEQGILGGASSGAVYMACLLAQQKYGTAEPDTTSLLIMPDNGSAYLDSIYNPQWVAKNFGDSLS